ncbi:MAG: hypothetical protein M9885_00310 [Burkholderiaceae bacterium]|nr:hypothetical protein [Burkholderiaceae bacterium]
MIAELVTFQLPPSMTRDEAMAAARATVAKWQADPDLIRKHFLLEPGNRTSGFYLWTSREAAERAHDATFRQGVRERFGSDPEIRYFDVMMVLDNLSGEVVEDLGRPVRSKDAGDRA